MEVNILCKEKERDNEKPDEPEEPVEESRFEKKLEGIINATSQENASNTPDFILAQFMNGCLQVFNTTVQQRENWYGRDPRPTDGSGDAPTGKPAEKEVAYPEHEKVEKLDRKNETVGEFLDWLTPQSSGYTVAEKDPMNNDDRLVYVSKSNEKIIAEYFDIDLKKLEKEKRKMLADIRKGPVGDKS